MINPIAVPRPRPRNTRRAHTAAQDRRKRNNSARYTSLVRAGVVILVLFGLVFAYVTLTSSLTGYNYALSRAQAKREALIEETTRLDDQLAALRSQERLAGIAARLGMHEPQRFALVPLAPAQTDTSPRVAFLRVLQSWFSRPPAPHRSGSVMR